MTADVPCLYIISRHLIAGFLSDMQYFSEIKLIPILSLAALACVIVISCSESPTPTNTVEASELFPNSTGCVWKYAAYDSISGSTDTVTVEIVGSIKLSNGEHAAVWKHQKSDTIWYRYISLNGSRVVEYPEITGGSANLIYRFPLTVGKKWISNHFWADTSRIVRCDSTGHPACTLGAAFLVERSWSAGASYGFANTWFVPGVGIIQSDLFSVNSVDTTRETWELISCSLVENIDSTNMLPID